MFYLVIIFEKIGMHAFVCMSNTYTQMHLCVWPRLAIGLWAAFSGNGVIAQVDSVNQIGDFERQLVTIGYWFCFMVSLTRSG